MAKIYDDKFLERDPSWRYSVMQGKTVDFKDSLLDASSDPLLHNGCLFMRCLQDTPEEISNIHNYKLFSLAKKIGS